MSVKITVPPAHCQRCQHGRPTWDGHVAADVRVQHADEPLNVPHRRSNMSCPASCMYGGCFNLDACLSQVTSLVSLCQMPASRAARAMVHGKPELSSRSAVLCCLVSISTKRTVQLSTRLTVS